MKFIASCVTLLLIASSLAACNTVNGFGKDLQQLGKQIDEKSSK
jgi:predicted small secreted protein